MDDQQRPPKRVDRFAYDSEHRAEVISRANRALERSATLRGKLGRSWSEPET